MSKDTEEYQNTAPQQFFIGGLWRRLHHSIFRVLDQSCIEYNHDGGADKQCDVHSSVKTFLASSLFSAERIVVDIEFEYVLSDGGQ